VLTFSQGLLPDHELDVQVAVQSGGVPLNDAQVTVDIMVPANVTGPPLDGIELGTLQVARRGSSGKSIRVKISFAPLAVYCQKDNGWVLAFGEGQ